MEHFYHIAGLSVRSQICLTGLIDDQASPPDNVDVSIGFGAVPETFGCTTENLPTWEMDGDRFLLRIAKVARFLISSGREILVEAAKGCPPDDLSIFVSGTAFGILLHQRGRIVLHASAVRVGERAVLFCGPSGAGKSTLAAALGRSGFALVSDDICALDVGDRATSVEPDGRQLKLWSESIEGLALRVGKGIPVRTDIEKFYVEPALSHPGRLLVSAAYVLRESRPPLKQGIHKRNILDAARLLSANAYRPLLVSRMAQSDRYFKAAAAIANSIDVFHLTRPLDFAAMPEIVSLLECHWRELGLLKGIDGA